MTPFIVLALPRSRTAWLANYLSYEGRQVGHDISIWCDTPSDFVNSFAPVGRMAGTVETSAILGWRLMMDRMPGAKFVALQRPIGEVLSSLDRLGLKPDRGELVERSLMLESFARAPGVLSLQSSDLDSDEAGRRLFNELLGEPFDPAWWLHFHGLNIQVNFSQRFAAVARRWEAMLAFRELVIEETKKMGSPCSMS